METEEIEIEASWGNIAVKAWGKNTDPPILCVHGIMDNAGSFDGLIQLLPSTYYYICVDLPGHGLSSKFPAHMPTYHSLSNLLVYRIVTDYFKQEKYILMGHSWGGQLGLLFTQMYPEKVEKLILLDATMLLPVPSSNSLGILAYSLEFYIQLDQKMKSNVAPFYTYNQALEKMTTGRRSPLTEKAARALLERMLLPVGENTFWLNYDQRLKTFVNPLKDYRDIIETLKFNPIACPVLVVRAKSQFNIQKPFESYFGTFNNFTVHQVEGTHDVHNNEPEKVAPLVINFLSHHKSKL